LRVGRKRRPVEVEGHVEMALLRRNHRGKHQARVMGKIFLRYRLVAVSYADEAEWGP
jgi:hypothetical protein